MGVLGINHEEYGNTACMCPSIILLNTLWYVWNCLKVCRNTKEYVVSRQKDILNIFRRRVPAPVRISSRRSYFASKVDGADLLSCLYSHDVWNRNMIFAHRMRHAYSIIYSCYCSSHHCNIVRTVHVLRRVFFRICIKKSSNDWVPHGYERQTNRPGTAENHMILTMSSCAYQQDAHVPGAFRCCTPCI